MKCTAAQIFRVIIFLFSAGVSILAQDALWEQTSGPITGTVTLLQSSGSEGDIWCLASNRIYHSIDNGKSWNLTNLPNRDISTLTVRENKDVFAAGRVICADECFQSGIFYSNNKGESWQTIKVGSSENVVIEFTNGANGRVFASTNDGIYYSDSGADTWLKTSIDSPDVRLRAFTSRENGLVAGVTNNSAYLSLDNGQTWKDYPYEFPSENQTERYIDRLAIYSDSILIGVYGGAVFRSTDSGKNWKQTILPITPGTIHNIQVTEEGQILIGADDGAFTSWDTGKTWSRLFPYGFDVYTFARTSKNELFVGTSDAVYLRQTDTTWIRSSRGIIESNVSELIYLSNGSLLAGTFYDGIFSTSDGGESWESLNFPFHTAIETIVELQDGEIAVGITGNPGLYLSDEDLTKWNPVSLKNIGSFTVGADNTLFAGAVGRVTHGVYRSTDLGETWAIVGLEDDEVNDLAADESGIIYAGTIGNGIFRSEDNGESWKQTELQDKNIRALTTGTGKLVFAGTISGDIYRSEDGGDSWENVHVAGAGLNDFVILPGGLIYAGTGNGVLCSADNGLTWQDYNAGLPEDTYRISLSYDADNFLYAGVWGDGVFRSITPVTSVPSEKQENLPVDFTSMQNYPNPFNPATTIEYTKHALTPTQRVSERRVRVKLFIYDILGRIVATLVDEHQNSGKYEVEFNAPDLPSGIYFYQLTSGSFTATKKMILLK